MVSDVSSERTAGARMGLLRVEASSGHQVLLLAAVSDAPNAASVVGRAARRGRLGDEGGQAEVGEDAVDAVGVLDHGSQGELGVRG